jgi:hypothetical protein
MVVSTQDQDHETEDQETEDQKQERIDKSSEMMDRIPCLPITWVSDLNVEINLQLLCLQRSAVEPSRGKCWTDDVVWEGASPPLDSAGYVDLCGHGAYLQAAILAAYYRSCGLIAVVGEDVSGDEEFGGYLVWHECKE